MSTTTTTPAPGCVRIGRIQNQNASLTRFKKHFPTFKPCVCLSASSAYGSLSPFCLKDEKGRLIENIWQFSKVYPEVPDWVCRKNQWDQTIIFSSKREKHVDSKNQPNELYWKWRKRGQEAKDPIRYPVGFKNRSQCLYAIKNDDKEMKHLDYVQSRKEIYLPAYFSALRKEEKFKNLKKELERGRDILVLEVDGPREESLPYYMNKYGVQGSFIDHGTTLATKENLDVFLNDTKHPFGHGFCLAAALLNIDLLEDKEKVEEGEQKKKDLQEECNITKKSKLEG